MIRFKVGSRKSSVGKNKGKILFYARQEKSRTVTLAQIEENISRSTTLTRGDVRAAVASLAEAVNEALLRGDSVDLGDLGTFRIKISSRQKENEEDVTYSCLRTPRVFFSPKKRMKDSAKTVSIELSNPKAKNLRSTKRNGESVAPERRGEASSSGENTVEHHESTNPHTDPKGTGNEDHDI